MFASTKQYTRMQNAIKSANGLDTRHLLGVFEHGLTARNDGS
jgi:hypothetical protein